VKTHPFRIVNVFTHDRGALTGNRIFVGGDVVEIGRGTVRLD